MQLARLREQQHRLTVFAEPETKLILIVPVHTALIRFVPLEQLLPHLPPGRNQEVQPLGLV